MSSSKRQSIIMTGVGLILLSALMLYFALTQPKVSDEVYIQSNSSSSETVTQSALQENLNSVLGEASQQSDLEEYQAEVTEYSEINTDNAFNGKINLNTCTASDLTVLDGIGESRADAIIQYREYLGGYTSVDQIKNIKGIGDKLYEKIAPYLTV
ncbi:MAG: ComEA family DNA-binding protein [Eubacterium sp.]